MSLHEACCQECSFLMRSYSPAVHGHKPHMCVRRSDVLKVHEMVRVQASAHEVCRPGSSALSEQYCHSSQCWAGMHDKQKQGIDKEKQGTDKQPVSRQQLQLAGSNNPAANTRSS